MPGSPSFLSTLDEHFPGALPASAFVGRTYESLFELGFDEHTAIACVANCRDELTHHLTDQISSTWGSAFNFSSLAGMMLLGKTGFGAALTHAPKVATRSRYVFFTLSHIGLSQEGMLGICHRKGQASHSPACGALVGLEREIRAGRVDLEIDPDDVEQSMLRQLVMSQLEPNARPSLLDLTRLVSRLVTGQLEHLIDMCVEPLQADYAVVSGVQIHGPDGRDFVHPGPMYAVVEQERLAVTCCGKCPD